MGWKVVPYIGTWIETAVAACVIPGAIVVPYIGTWIETLILPRRPRVGTVVPYIGTWIETKPDIEKRNHPGSYLI